jgi:hypothetical protein
MEASGLLATLRELEIALHQPEVRSDPERLGALLHPQFREVGRSGAEYTRAAVLQEFEAAVQAYRVWSQDFQLHPNSAPHSRLRIASVGILQVA